MSDPKQMNLWQAAIVLLWRPEFNEAGEPTGLVEMSVSIPNPTLPVALLTNLTGLLAQHVRNMEREAKMQPAGKPSIVA
jgi:hypothetical protein